MHLLNLTACHPILGAPTFALRHAFVELPAIEWDGSTNWGGLAALMFGVGRQVKARAGGTRTALREIYSNLP